MRGLFKAILIIGIPLWTILYLAFETDVFISDLRPAGWDQKATEEQGRELFEKWLVAQGAEAYDKKKKIKLPISHIIPNSVIRNLAFPLPYNYSTYIYRSVPGRGISSRYSVDSLGSKYLIARDTEGVYKEEGGIKDRKDAFRLNFFYRAIRHLLEFPYEMRSADVVGYIGRQTSGGREYDLLFLTWKDAAPGRDRDQYIVWVNRQTGLMDYIQATAHGLAPFLKAQVEFTWREIKGVQWPAFLQIKDVTFTDVVISDLRLMELPVQSGQ